MTVEMPRRLTVLRHAKADWPSVPDHERPLADRGRRDASLAGQWLAGTGINPQLVLCSTALRTRDTWKLVSHELPKRARRTVYEERLYEASPGGILALVQETSDEIGDLLLVGHNPGVQGVTEILAADAEGDTLVRLRRGGFPTSAIAVLTIDGSWKSAEPGAAKLVAFHSPRG
jgi:Phosphohistidine phosphatase SixA